jgi:hypothetical protein
VPTVDVACALTLVAWRLSALSVHDLWWHYIELGGNRPCAALTEYLVSSAAWCASEHNILVQALNEHLWELGIPSLAPYRDLEYDRPAIGPEIEQG